MLIPQYSIRWLLVLTTACGVVFSIFALAVRGDEWALGVSIGIVSLVVVLLIHAFVFTLLWAFSVVTSPFLRSSSGWRSSGFGRSPFVRDPSAQAAKVPAAAAGDKEIPATPLILE